MTQANHLPVDREPRVWLLLAEKLGDNAQVRALADALPWKSEIRNIRMKPDFQIGKPQFVPSLDHLDRHACDPIEPPWPDVLITIGRRPSMVALWIKERSPSTRIVLVGRPKRWLEQFDLVVAPPQYDMPPAANVYRLHLPLMRADREKVAQAANVWRHRLADMPRPLTAVLVGGQTRPFRFDAAAGGELAGRLRDVVDRDGGSLYLTTSRRTGQAVTHALARDLPERSRIYRFGEDPSEDNPYHALLGLADRFVVTGDSVSMQVEVAGLGKPLAIYPLPLDNKLRIHPQRWLARLLAPGTVLGDLLRRSGLAGYGRDLTGFHERLYRSGLAVRLGEPFREPSTSVADEVDGAAAAVCALVGAACAGQAG
ncbi:MAG: mitochondrial fission ELM1 family protein [Geminicoccaceae bacterium]|nr:mitochondrial fission ELM1 family protein [Geminicoccaceae bacterium]